MEYHLIRPCYAYYLLLASSFKKNVVKMTILMILVITYDVVDSRVDAKNEIYPDSS